MMKEQLANLNTETTNRKEALTMKKNVRTNVLALILVAVVLFTTAAMLVGCSASTQKAADTPADRYRGDHPARRLSRMGHKARRR